MYDPGSGAQLHDFNPGIAQSGLFWTVPATADIVQADLGAGTASYSMQDAHMQDYISFDNAVNGGGPLPRPGSVSFRVNWSTIGVSVVNDVPSKAFHGEHAPATAQMEWTARTDQFDFVSAPLASSLSPLGALLGHQRTGTFY